MKRSLVLVMAAGLLLCADASAQDPNYEIAVGSGAGAPGSAVSIPINLNFANGAAAAGFSFGVCHDPTLIDVDCLGGIPNDCVENGIIAEGAALAATNGGQGAQFFAPATTSTPIEGFTVGAVVNLLGGDNLAPADGAEVVVGQYSIPLPGPTMTTVTPLQVCETGNPLVVLSVGLAGGGDVVPVSSDGMVTIEVIGPVVPFTFIAPSPVDPLDPNDPAVITYNPETGEGSGDIFLQLDEDELTVGFPNDTQGFSYGLRHDDNVFIEDAGVPPVTDRGIRPAPIIAALNGSAGPDFFGPNADPANGPGHTVGVVYALLGGVFLQFPDPADIIVVTYNTEPSLFAGNLEGRNVRLSWAHDLGDPPVTTTVVAPNLAVDDVNFVNGRIQLLPGDVATPFVRGDSNDDNVVNIADGIYILNFLFQMGPAANCMESTDADGDGSLTFMDGQYVILYRLLDGPPPPAPFPDCGTVDMADCVAFNSCP